MNDILISGAGIAGLCLARQLKRHGIAYTMIEKKSQLDAVGAGIALPANAVRALRHIGLAEFVDTLHQVNRIMHYWSIYLVNFDEGSKYCAAVEPNASRISGFAPRSSNN